MKIFTRKNICVAMILAMLLTMVGCASNSTPAPSTPAAPVETAPPTEAVSEVEVTEPPTEPIPQYNLQDGPSVEDILNSCKYCRCEESGDSSGVNHPFPA